MFKPWYLLIATSPQAQGGLGTPSFRCSCPPLLTVAEQSRSYDFSKYFSFRGLEYLELPSSRIEFQQRAFTLLTQWSQQRKTVGQSIRVSTTAQKEAGINTKAVIFKHFPKFRGPAAAHLGIVQS
jgi:hypothetical protein